MIACLVSGVKNGEIHIFPYLKLNLRASKAALNLNQGMGSQVIFHDPYLRSVLVSSQRKKH